MKSSVRRSSRLATSSTASARKPWRRTSLKKNHGYEGSGVVCPRCEQTAKFHGYRRKAAFSLMGPVPCVRAYY